MLWCFSFSKKGETVWWCFGLGKKGKTMLWCSSFSKKGETMLWCFWSSQAHTHMVKMLSLCLWHILAELAHSFLFCFCVYHCPSNCISFHKFSPQLSAFSLCSSGLISALLVLSTMYLVMKVSLSHDVNSLWLTGVFV